MTRVNYSMIDTIVVYFQACHLLLSPSIALDITRNSEQRLQLHGTQMQPQHVQIIACYYLLHHKFPPLNLREKQLPRPSISK